MKFYKYCGAGNDFVLLENFDGALSDYPALARRLCDRHFSVGADGLIVLEPAEHGADCKMRFFNNDGTAAEMCGNGARCLCRHCRDFGLSGDVQRIETPAGLVTGEYIADDRYRIELNRPSVIESGIAFEDVLCDYLVLGENGIPHAVAPCPPCDDLDELRKFASRLRHFSHFPRGANVNLWTKISENSILLRTFERGVEDFTLACGTGSGATVAALTRSGVVSGNATEVHTDGGLLSVDIVGECDAPRIFLTGPAICTFTGTVAL